MTAKSRIRLWIAGLAIALTVVAVQSAADMAALVGQRGAISAASSDLAALSRFDARVAASGGLRLEPTDPSWAAWSAMAGPSADAVDRARSWLDRIDHVALGGGGVERAADLRWYVRKAAAELRSAAAITSTASASSWDSLARNLLLSYILVFAGALGVYFLSIIKTAGITVVTTRAAAGEAREKPIEVPGLGLAHVRHELRTPLTVILAYAAELQNSAKGEALEFATAIRDSANRLHDTLEELLTYADLVDDSSSIAREPIEIHSIVESVISRLRPMAFEKRLSFVYRATKTEAWINANADAIEAAVSHLVENALKYTEKGSVVVSVDADGARVRVSVEDTGRGFEENRLSELASPFAQGSTGDAREHEGVGLGLTIARQVAEASGGRLTASSLPDVGSRFAITLPLLSEAAALPKAA
ncbi:MAG: HAMP domain-containing histidine kinase [Rhodothermales bacterium]|nr:HAMP domain-containing histidine kinase [Rhodothermales bacterium]